MAAADYPPGEADAARRLADPALDAAELQAIAGAFPALLPQVAVHPQLYPELRAWLESLGRPDVNAAFAARAWQAPAGAAAPEALAVPADPARFGRPTQEAVPYLAQQAGPPAGSSASGPAAVGAAAFAAPEPSPPAFAAPQPPGLSPDRAGAPQGRGPRRALTVIGAALLSLATLLSLAFPVAARVYASNAVEAIPNANAGEPASPGADGDPADPDEPAAIEFDDSLPRDMGIRNLPILSDWAIEQWETGDLEAAIQAAGERAFGDTWNQIWSAPRPQYDWYSWDGESQRMVVPALEAAIGTLGTGAESDLLDLGGLLTLAAGAEFSDSSPASWDQGHLATYAVALSQAAAAHFGSCDANLAAAHATSLIRSWSWEHTASLYQDAITLCPGDATPLVERARAVIMTMDTLEHWWGTPDTDLVTEHISELVSAVPDVAAAHALAGDAFAWLALRTDLGPFSVKHFQEQAVASYRLAASLSSEPALRLALAQAQLVAGSLDEAAESLAALPPDVAPRSSDSLSAAIAAVQGDAAGALELADNASQAEDPPAPIIMSDLSIECEIYSRSPPFQTLPTGARVGLILDLSGCGAAEMVEDLGFTPTYRTSLDTNNPRAVPIRDSTTPTSLREYAALAADWQAGRQWCDQGSSSTAICAAIYNDGQIGAMTAQSADAVQEAMQDLMRRWGLLDRALAWNEAWTKSAPNEPRAWERLGEVKFLLGDWAGAADASAQAVDLYTSRSAADVSFFRELDAATGPGWALLRRASAERQRGNHEQAIAILEQAGPAQLSFNGSSTDAAGADLQLVQMYAALERGLAAYAQDDPAETASAMGDSISARNALNESFSAEDPVVTGAQEQALSLAYFKLGDFQAALDWANLALEADPYSPLYQEAVADAQRALAGEAEPEEGDNDPDNSGGGSAEVTGEPGGDPAASGAAGNEDAGSGGGDSRAQLIAAYEAALELDPTLFSSWNNLGVLLAQEGQEQAAVDAFKRAIRAVPDYGYAWFNLGAVEAGRPGFEAFLISQGALGKAAAIDPSWKGKDPVLTFDDEVYQSGLDVSKPIPDGWRLAQTVRASTPAITAGLVLVLVLRLGKEIGAALFTERFARGAMRRGSRRRRLGALAAPRWPAVVTAAVSLGALLWVTGADGWREAALVGLAVATLLGWHALAPRFLAAGRAARHRSFPLASLVTAALAPFGLGFAPPAPLADDAAQPVSARRAGIAAVGLATMVFAAVAVATAVPTARAAAVAGVLIISSAMVPFHPLDGARIQAKKWAEWAITLTLLAATAAVALTWL
ncbi:MAG: tetratricopeptide repeat protein [Bifidobacteriaceae bacterium]|nr:tetratricopeptide repeat protein [Bifidobacteriaceae bacterium]